MVMSHSFSLEWRQDFLQKCFRSLGPWPRLNCANAIYHRILSSRSRSMSLKDKSVLIVDDMKMVRARLKIILTEMGAHHVQEAVDGLQAFESLKSGKFDLVLSDWNMPNSSGIDLLKHMRADSSLAKIPVLFITSEAQRAQMVQALT